jgi:hypothetical protein
MGEGRTPYHVTNSISLVDKPQGSADYAKSLLSCTAGEKKGRLPQ